MAKSYLDKTGLALVWSKIKQLVSTKVDKVDGKGLSTNDYTSAEKTKLSGIATGAQVNVLEGIQKNGTTVSVTNKIANITVPTKTSDITNDSGFITNASIPSATTTTPKMNGTAAVGTQTTWAKGDHVHPSDTSRVPTTRTVNGHALSSNVTVTKGDVGLGNAENTADADKVVKSAGKLTTARAIDGVNFNGSAAIIHYGTCSTTASTATKEVSCTGFTLTTGSWIAIKFSVTNSAAVANLKLSVNGTTAAAIKYRGGNLPSTGTLTAGRVYLFVYDGTNYELIGDLDTNSTYSVVTTSSNGLMLATDKVKLDSLSIGEAEVIGSDGVTTVGGYTLITYEGNEFPVVTAGSDGIVPRSALPEATTSSKGAMTGADKTKLNGIATGAEVNQNAFSNVKVGSTTVAADGKTDTLELVAGSNVTITPDATNDKITIAATDTTYSEVSTSAAGLMSTSDKTKLNGIATGAEVNQNAFSNVKVGSTTVAADAKTDTLELAAGSNITITPDATNDKITISASNTTYSDVVANGASGLMSGSDKSKLDGIATGAQVNQSAFSNIKVGSTTVVADTKTDTLELVAGTNITITPDATNDKITITATDTTYTAASATPLMDGTGAVGSSAKYAREDHVHPSDTTRVPTSRTVNGKALSSNITLSASDVSAVATSAVGAANGVCPLNASKVIDSQYLPSFVDDIVEAYARTSGTALSSNWLSTTSATGSALTPETGKIYVLMADSGDYAANTQFRWSGSAYVKLNDGGVSPITNEEINTICA